MGMAEQELLANLLGRIEANGDFPAECGFPVRLEHGEMTTVISLEEPPLLTLIGANKAGAACIAQNGRILARWGLAAQTPWLGRESDLSGSSIWHWVADALEDGVDTRLHKQLRLWRAPLNDGRILLVVFDAEDEELLHRRALRLERQTEILRRLGKALTSNQTIQPLALSSLHAIVSSADLTAGLLWVRDDETGRMELSASLGVTAEGAASLQSLNPSSSPTCVAELAIHRGTTLQLRSIADSLLTVELEAKICESEGEALIVLPLMIGEDVLGVLELISKRGDAHFSECRPVFEAAAEHMALALNSAKMFEAAERMASHDALTGIANHRTLQSFLQKRVQECRRSGGTLAVVMLDVDHFRNFNEEEGHDAGDIVLQMVSTAMKESIRGYDLAARYGGEEFTVIMPGANRDEAMAAAERMRLRIEELEYRTSSGRRRHITASLGVAVMPEAAEEPGALLKAADIALFEAKGGGRNQVVLFEGAVDEDRRKPSTHWTEALGAVPERMQAECRNIVDRALQDVNRISKHLGFSSRQKEVLLAALLMAKPLLDSDLDRSRRLLRAWSRCTDLRPVLPTLEYVRERYDGGGPRGIEGHLIPLTSRALTAICAVHVERIGSLREDAGRFDPEIMGLLVQADEAA